GQASPAKVTVPGTAVTASADDGHVPANTVDGSLSTRWPALGNGQWIRYDLGTTRLVALVKIAWYQGAARQAFFEIQTSSDGTTFTTRFSGQSSGTTTALETYDFSDVSARYVRVLGHGNTVNSWNSITETEVWAETDSGSCSGALSSVAAIQQALQAAGPGSVISIAPGIYTGARSSSGDPGGQGLFFGGANGPSASHAVLKGCNPSSRPVLQGTGTGDGSYGLHLTGDFWEIRDLEVRTAQKGIMLDNANHVLISNVTVSNIGDEGVHFRDGSSFNTLENSRILNTGRFQPGFADGASVASDTISS